VSAAVGKPLVFDQSVWEGIESFFARSGRTPTPNNRRQAYVIEGSRVLPNPNGTAPGLIVDCGEKTVILLPGPPAELIPMYDRHVADFLRSRGAGGCVIHSRVLKACMLGESAIEERLRDLMVSARNPTVAPYAYPGEVHLRITAKARSAPEAAGLIEPVEREIRSRVGRFVFGADDDTLESAVGALLRRRRFTVGIGESCTGGLLGHRLTQVPGCSQYFLGGSISYSNDMKVRTLGVRQSTLNTCGAVSEEAALEMARGARSLTGGDIGVGVTGIAGPSGGSEAKPVGTVHVAICGPMGETHRRLALWGSRETIKWRASQEALATLWRYLGGGADEGG
ncbi:MAG: CinA family nicotinamide mononucleotide deamidase-related protein, partial [Firmicutes bacterium]|nr:CinA family nicotinamide mononucleotide deamidase-related protein [Bacillota bacterium]